MRSCLLNVSSTATLGEGGNLSFIHLFTVLRAALVVCGSGHPQVQVIQEDSCTRTGTLGTVFGQMKSQFKLTGNFLNQHLAFSVCYFFISTEISPDTLPKFQLIITSHLSSVHCCSLRGYPEIPPVLKQLIPFKIPPGTVSKDIEKRRTN